MLKKLFVYDMKTLSRSQVPFILGILGAGALGLLCMLATFLIPEDLSFLTVFPMLISYLLMMAVSVAASVASIFILIHYYKKFFSDEGYLTFMFPVSVETQFLSKLLSGTIFSVLGVLASLFSFLLIFCAMIGSVMPMDLADLINILFSGTGGFSLSASVIVTIVLIILLILIAPVSQLALYYAAVTLGSIFFSKHKIIGSVVFYMVANFVVGIVTFAATLIVAIITAILQNEFIMMITMLSVYLIMLIAIGIVGYFISVYMLKRKINLE